HRAGRDREAAPDHPGIAHDVLDRERRCQVLRDHSRDVRRDLPRAQRAQRHGAPFPHLGHPERGDLQRADHHRTDSARASRRALPARRCGADPASQLHHLRYRRRHHPLCRDQGARRAPRHPSPGLTMIGKHLRPSIVLTLVICVITGLLYPAAVTAIAQLIFPKQANGSIVTVDGHPVGSALIGQSFSAPYYFHARPSAAGAGYDATASGGPNKGPTDLKLADTLIAGAVETVVKEDGAEKGKIPSDMVTNSASGLDPHISPANAAL